jgi:predicted nucleotidyltransferase
METIEQLFKPSWQTITEYVLEHPSEEVRVRKLARKIRESPAKMSRFVQTLKKIGIVAKGRIDLTNPLTRACKIMLNIRKLKAVIDKISKKELAGIGVYGSWANGTNTETSDLDIWITVNQRLKELEIGRIEKKISKATKSDARVITLTKERIDAMKEKDFVFYCSLKNSFRIWGEEID